MNCENVDKIGKAIANADWTESIGFQFKFEPLNIAHPRRPEGTVATALSNRVTGRMCDMEIDERSDTAMVSDLAPVFAALSQRPHETQ